MIYTPKQRELMRLWQRGQLKRINLLEGSVSSGKTWISLVLWAFWVRTMPEDKLYMMCAKSMTTLKRNCLILLQELVGKRNFTFSVPAKEGRLFGRRVLFEGANDARSESKIRGMTLQGAYCDELTQFPEDFFAMLLSRLRVSGAKLFATTNPDNPNHWLMRRYIERADKLDFLDVKFTIDDNTTLPADYVENIKREYTGLYYDRFILGLWVLASGLIYDMFSPEVNGYDDRERPKGLPYVSTRTIACDYGTTNPCVFLDIYDDGETVWVDNEYRWDSRNFEATGGLQKTDGEYAEDFRRFMGADEQFYCAAVVDPSAASFITELRRRGWYVIEGDNDVLDGIRRVSQLFARRKIRVHRERCKGLMGELQSYVWDTKAAQQLGVERPVKQQDHAPDALRYYVNTVLPKWRYGEEDAV